MIQVLSRAWGRVVAADPRSGVHTDLGFGQDCLHQPCAQTKTPSHPLWVGNTPSELLQHSHHTTTTINPCFPHANKNHAILVYYLRVGHKARNNLVVRPAKWGGMKGGCGGGSAQKWLHLADTAQEDKQIFANCNSFGLILTPPASCQTFLGLTLNPKYSLICKLVRVNGGK